jgi:hypothetical protein
MDTSSRRATIAIGDVWQEITVKWVIFQWRRRMGIEPTHRGLNPEHWI